MESAWAASLGGAHPAYVVDTLQECIVPCTETTRRYCSLSYTWGQASQLKTATETVPELMKPGSLGKDKHGILVPETIRDAFAITRILEERYIWVDSLCIVQDDLDILQIQLSQMHLIYANSVVCIVAEVGHDASEGIRGIKGASLSRQSSQAVHKIAGGEKIVGSRLSLAEMGEKPVIDYHQRAWTFQEYLFARRRLIFGRAGMRWSCPSGGWREDLHAHPDIDKAGAIDHRLFLAGRWLRSPVPSLTNLSLLVWTFNEKWLSFPEDAIRAFSGIQSVLHRIYEGGLVYGHPELFFDISLAWMGSVTRRHASPSFAGDRLQDRLPSWSWIGWHGRAQFPCDAELHMQYQQTELGEGFLEPVTQWYTMSTPTGPRRAIKSRWHLYKQNPRAGMEGWERVPSRPKDSSFPGEMRSTLPRTMPSSGYSTSLVTEYSASTPLPFWYPVPLPDWSKAAPELSEQTQYLFCRTTRASMAAGTRLAGPRSWEVYNAVALADRYGATVGVVFASSQDEAEALQASKGSPALELIAVAKGWTVSIADAAAYEEEVHELHHDKIDCYFVMWVEWREGIAYRKAAGRVYVSAWDEVKDDNVELVLG
ncbi:heterokaryon incompatibility protein-domain-containing protein [Plectosphaerella plurivora]|uniref:Heterokaryon incompatibility protein-domain-containing protein n=1 Tax=Plectosphaerella plurivora TaxID=936078 RepID=A0A9P8VB63_9PEZI|nr:heterokaryon incompatibility protein-domain-containing protein [Plectosphaerella plurivora]